MSPTISLSKDKVKLRIATANIMLVANAFVWYLLAFNTLKQLLGPDPDPSDSLLIFGVNTGAIALSGLLGSFLTDKLKKREQFLYVWLVIGIVLSLLPLGLNTSNLTNLTIISLVFGVYFGLGMPATMGYHSAFSNIEGRAKIGGLSFLIIGAVFAVAGFLIFDSLFVTSLVLAFVRILGLLFFHFLHEKEVPKKEPKKVVKYTSIFTNRSFLLYFAPWCFFALINYMTIPVQQTFFSSNSNYEFFTAMENVVIAFVAVASGFLADKWGRKRLTIIGFIMLGIGYAFMALSPDIMLGSLIYIISDGIAWGIFYVVFVFTLWGDLAQGSNSDKFYYLGAMPYVSSYFMQLLLKPSLGNIPPTMVFSFASVFLFLAVLPLIYAPETLPEKTMKDRDLKSYIEKAQKIVKKESLKKQKIEKETSHAPKEETSEEYKKAQEMAEKYY